MAAAKKKDWLGYSGICLLFGLMIWGVFLLQQGENRRYQNEGIEASARVVNKWQQSERSGTNNTTNHYFDITYMDQSDVEESETTIDLLEGEFEFGEINIGEFQRAEVDVRRSSYNSTEIGDTVSVLFLPTDPTKARLTEEVLNYTPLALWVLIGFCGLGALFFLFKFIIAPADKPVVQDQGATI